MGVYLMCVCQPAFLQFFRVSEIGKQSVDQMPILVGICLLFTFIVPAELECFLQNWKRASPLVPYNAMPFGNLK